MLLAVNDDTGPSHVATAGDHNDVSGIELNEVGDLVLFDVELDSVVGLDARVWVADSPTIMGNNVGDALRANGQFSDL